MSDTTAAEAASISILSSGELCSGAVAANERSESATGTKLQPSKLQQPVSQSSVVPLFEDKPNLWVSAISSSVVQAAVQGQVSRIISKIHSLCLERHFIAWPPESCSPLLFVMNYKNGVSYHGQADNFCEVHSGVSPELLYFYSTADEEF